MIEYKNAFYTDSTFTVLDHVKKDATGNIELHKNTKTIEKDAFQNSLVIKVALPEGLEIIVENAFANCKCLKEISFPSTLTKIGSSAFSGCKNLEKIDLSMTKLDRINLRTFFGCEKLKEVKLPKSVRSIYLQAFDFCDIRNINLDNVAEIYDAAFGHCKNFKLVIPPSVKLFTISSLDGTGTKNLFLPNTIEKLLCTPIEKGSIEKITYDTLPKDVEDFLLTQRNFLDTKIQNINLENILGNNTFKQANKIIKDLEKNGDIR